MTLKLTNVLMSARQKGNTSTATLISLIELTKNTRLTPQSMFEQPGATARAAPINHKGNAAKYDSAEVSTIKKRIKKAAKKYDVAIQD